MYNKHSVDGRIVAGLQIRCKKNCNYCTAHINLFIFPSINFRDVLPILPLQNKINLHIMAHLAVLYVQLKKYTAREKLHA
jgi:hypothetical protein